MHSLSIPPRARLASSPIFGLALSLPYLLQSCPHLDSCNVDHYVFITSCSVEIFGPRTHVVHHAPLRSPTQFTGAHNVTPSSDARLRLLWGELLSTVLPPQINSRMLSVSTNHGQYLVQWPGLFLHQRTRTAHRAAGTSRATGTRGVRELDSNCTRDVRELDSHFTRDVRELERHFTRDVPALQKQPAELDRTRAGERPSTCDASRDPAKYPNS